MQDAWYPRNYYKLIHNQTGKMYIGQREKCDVGTSYFGSGVDWCRHRKKYGWKDITVLENIYFTDKNQAQAWLDHQEDIHGDYWLTEEFANKVPETTDDKATRKGFKHTEETKKRMSEIRKGRYQFGGVKHHSDESRKKCQIIARGGNSPMKIKEKNQRPIKVNPKPRSISWL